jgi:hypothetical protein
MATPHFGDGVVRCRVMRVDRRGEANSAISCIAQRIIVESREISENLDEFKADRFRLDKKFQKFRMELRLASDELNHAAAERVSLAHDGFVVFCRQQVTLTTVWA